MSAAAEYSWPPPQAEWSSVFETAPFGMVQCQPRGNITATNPALEQLLGAMPRTARSLRFADMIPPQDHATVERLLRELLEGERATFQIDASLASVNGRPMRWVAWRVRGTNGSPDHVLAMARETDDNHQAEQRLREAGKLEAVGRLAGGVAHDFNNLLTGVLLYCDLLLANLEPCHRVRKYAEEIRKAGMQASGLVRQLLAVARPAKSEPRLLSLNEIAEALRNLLNHLIGENIELRFDLDANLGLVRMDPTAAQQILLNLVLNSRDAMPGGGRVTVETRNCQIQVLAEPPNGSPASLPCALFAVADTGAGMDAHTRAHLFETFFTTKAGKGTGLGLATVHDIVTSHGGLIHVDSAPGAGTRITVLLPLAPVPQAVCEMQATLNQKGNEGDPPPTNSRNEL